jgi:hypothetical protein
MKTQINSFLLLLVLSFPLFVVSQSTKGQTSATRDALSRSVDNVRRIAKTQTVKLALIAKQYFEEHPDEIDFSSEDFRTFVNALVKEREALPAERQGSLAGAVNKLQTNYLAYNNSITGGQSGNPNPGQTPPVVSGNSPESSVTPKITGSGQQTGTGTPETNNSDAENNADWDTVDYLVAGASAAAALLVAGTLVFAFMTLLGMRRTIDDVASALPKSFSAMTGRQDEFAKAMVASAGTNKDINQRLTEVQSELRQMSRVLQQTARTNNNRPAGAPISYIDAPPPRVSEMPVFPIAGDVLLRQMHSKAVVVKRDFQNDMLVSDPDGKGELVLIRDSGLADEVQPLFIVPRVTQFQMRQEYYNFYEKYYDCANPESGAVWIVDPAVVEKVAGGWQLREKGRLEIR